MQRIPHRDYVYKPPFVSETLKEACAVYQKETGGRNRVMTIDEEAYEAAVRAYWASADKRGGHSSLCGDDLIAAIEAYEQAEKPVSDHQAERIATQETLHSPEYAKHTNTALVKKLVDAASLHCGNTHMYLESYLDGSSNRELQEEAKGFLHESKEALYEALTEAQAWLEQQEGKSSDGMGDYRPHPDTSFEVRIKNAILRLNLDRNDIKGLPDGASLSRNIADDRQIAALLEDLLNYHNQQPIERQGKCGEGDN